MEKEPLVVIHLSLGYHLPEDISRLPVIREQTESFFLPHTHNIYIKEDASTSNQMASSLPHEYQRTGSYLDAWLQAGALYKDKRRMPQAQLEYVKARALGVYQPNTGSDVMDVVAAVAAFSFREFIMLDELSQTRDFELVMESYPDSESRRITRQCQTQIERLNKSFSAAIKGDTESAVRLCREAMVLQAQLLPRRNRGYVDRLATMIGDAISNERATRIFIRVGETHYVVADRLADDPRLQAPTFKDRWTIFSVFDFGQLLQLPHEYLLLALEADPSLIPTDEQIFQAMIGLYVDWNLADLGKLRPERVEKANKVASLSTPEEILQLIRSFPAQGFERVVGRFTYSKMY